MPFRTRRNVGCVRGKMKSYYKWQVLNSLHKCAHHMTMGLMQVIQGQISTVVLPSKTQYFLLFCNKEI
jgi:hypothetical protein